MSVRKEDKGYIYGSFSSITPTVPTTAKQPSKAQNLEHWKSMVQKYIDEQKPVVGDEGLKHLLNAYENAGGNRNDFTLTKGVPTISTDTNYDTDGAIAAAYQAQLDSLKRTKEYTEELVAAAKEEAIRNAYAQYDKGKATYGRNAEQLAQMGLSNSGYGDYVEGKAYGAMVGGITDANESADKAIRDAYYNYEQGKSKATAEYNASLEAAKKAYNDKYIGLLTAVEKGEIDAETANKIAKAYNLDETHISEIATIADNYGTEKKEKAILYLDDAVKNGVADEDGNITYLTEERIKSYGEENGLSEEEIAAYISQNNENIDKATVENYKQQITADTTDDIIDNLNFVGENGEFYKKQLKKERDKLIISETIGEINTNGATTETIESADSYISGGKNEEGQKIYFHNDIKLIESLGKDNDLTVDEIKTTLEHHLKTGRLSEIDYNNLIKYLEKKTTNGDISVEGTKNRFWDDILLPAVSAYGAASGSPLAKWIGGVAVIGNIINAINGKDAYATIGDNRYRVNIDDSAEIGTEQQTTFNAAAGNSNILKQGEDYFIKIKDKWYKVKSKLTEEGFFDAVNNKISSDTLVTAPAHNQQDY